MARQLLDIDLIFWNILVILGGIVITHGSK